jgi:DUF971 family protein
MSTVLSMGVKQPKMVKRLEDKGLRIAWKDGHVSEYTYPYLRRLCPCAECSMIRHGGQDVHSLFGPDGIGDLSRIISADNIRAIHVELVGRYAIQFAWSDGHSTGIYAFGALREICPCPACAPPQISDEAYS